MDKKWDFAPVCENDSCWKNSSSCIKERKRIFNEMLNFEWHMLKSLCEISFLEFQIVVNISLEKVKEECAFNYPRLSFNLIYYRTLRSLSSSVFLSFFFSRWIQNFGLNVVSSQHATRWDFSPCCLKKQNVCQKSSFFLFFMLFLSCK